MNYPVISIQNPWAHAIMHLGKDVENRFWSPTYRGWLWVHSSKKPQPYPNWDSLTLGEMPDPTTTPNGCLLGVVKLVNVVELRDTQSKWAEGPCCWVLENPRLLPKPYPIRGRQNLWRLPAEVIEELKQIVAKTKL